MTDALETVWHSTAAAGEDADEEAWGRATGCPGWSAQDVLSHMIWSQRMLRGIAQEEVPLPEGLDHASSAFGQYMEWAVQERRDRPAADVLAEFTAGAAETIAHLRSLPPDEMTAEAPGPMGSMVRRDRLMSISVFDQWVHEQDVRRALGRPGHIEGEVAEHARDRIAVGLGHSLPQAIDAGDPPVVRFEIVGAAARRFTLDLSQRPAPPTEAPPRPPDVTLSMPFNTFVALGCGRAVPLAQGRGRVRVDGDPLLADDLLGHLSVTP